MLKFAVKIIFFISLGLVLFGYFSNNYLEASNGKLYIGFGVFSFAFVFMPLFIYLRYKDRVGRFIDERMEQPNKKT